MRAKLTVKTDKREKRSTPMRRHDREITDLDAIIEVMKKCDVCRLALNDAGGYPYILPLNFGMTADDGKIELYFHGANEGTKYGLIAKDNRASFEMDCAHRLVLDEETKNCTMEYESVIGQGTIEILSDEQKPDALKILMSHYRAEDFKFNKAIMPQTTVFKLTVSSVTGKRRMKKH